LVSIKVNPTDKRSKHIQLTEKGSLYLTALQPVWASFAQAIKQVLIEGHPDILNIMQRIDKSVDRLTLFERFFQQDSAKELKILDYRPSLKPFFFELAGHWLLNVLNGKLEEEDVFTLHNPDRAYLDEGGFVFFASLESQIVGCVALKRLSDSQFEFCKLFINPEYRKYGIATQLIHRCISRCKENQIAELWLQTANSMKAAHQLYYKLGFIEKDAPPEMTRLKRTEKVMVLDL